MYPFDVGLALLFQRYYSQKGKMSFFMNDLVLIILENGMGHIMGS